jgi:hypothetical protein
MPREENVIYVIFNFPETQRWRENFLEKKWLMIKEKIACTNCRMLQKPQNSEILGVFLYKVRC